LDVHNLKITDPKTLESAMNQIAGVVTVGLFARRRADVLIIAGDAGVRTLDL
jgi:ribose 5-phosphate isomerase A